MKPTIIAVTRGNLVITPDPSENHPNYMLVAFSFLDGTLVEEDETAEGAIEEIARSLEGTAEALRALAFARRADRSAAEEEPKDITTDRERFGGRS